MTNNLFDFLRMGGTTNTPPVRHKMRSVLLILGLLLGSMSVWGAEVTTTWTATSGALGSGIGSGTISTTVSGSSDTQEWSYTRTLSSGTSYTGWTSSCIQLGKKGGVESLTLSTSNIPGTIKSVSVECSSYQAKHNVSITVGETEYLGTTATPSWTTVGTKSGEGTSSGEIVISFTGGSRALYIKSITVVYDEGGTPDPVLESITVDGDLSTKEYEEGTDIDFTGLTATGHYDNETTADLTSSVDWSFSPALTAGLTSVTVTATKDAISGNKVINGLIVNEHVVTPDEYEIPTNNALWGTSFNGSAGVTTLSGTSHDISITINKNTGSGMYVNDAQTRIYNGYTMVFSVPSGYVITAIQFTADGGNWAGEHTADVGTMTDNKNWSGSSNTVTISIAGTCRMTGVTVTFEAEAADAPSVTISPVAVDATAAAVADGLIDATYENIDLENVSVGRYNDAECTEAFAGDWLTVSLNGDKDIAYSISANNAFEVRTAYIKLTAPASNGTSPDVVKVIAVNQAAKEYVFANLAELLENVTPTGTAQQVTVTLTNEVIVGLDGTQGIYLNVTYGPSATTKQIEIYCKNAPTMVAGGTVSGTLENCNWKTFGSTWELCPANWTEITYTAPKAVSSVVVTGTPTKASYVDGEKFNPAGLTVNVNYTDDTHEVIDASMATWAYNPSQVLAKDQTSVGVQATYNEVQSVEYIVSGLTVGEIPTKTVAEFIAAEGMRCYLVGTVSDIETGTKLKYGNFNLTDASGTIYVYGCLDTEGNAEQFGSLDVEDGDKIKVIAETYKYYGSKDEAVNVQFVQEINVAKITIDNMSMEFGDVATINATITPAAAANAVTYAIKAGSDDCITLEGDQVTAKSVAGTATIVATISDAPEYDGAVKEFTVTVTAPDSRYTAIIDGITAINGTLVTETAGAHKDKEYISYVAQKGDASNAPIIPSGKSFVRIYQNGGYLALNAVKGCVIDEVIVSIPSTCNSTTIAVGTDEENLPTTGGTAATAGNDFSTGTGLNSQNVYLVCLGTTSSTRLEVGAITVKYTGNPIEVSSIAVGGTYQTEFEKNETFNHDGLVVTATYTDASVVDVTALAEFSDPDMTTLGVKTVTVSYGGKSTTYNIEVVAATLTEIALSGTYPTRFHVGDAFSHTGMTVTASYSDYSEEDVTASAIFSGYDMSVAGAQTVTVEFGGQSAEYQIIVVPENTDVLTADLIGVEGTSYADWSDKTGFGTSSVYAGNSTNGSGTNAGAIQLRYNASDETKQAGIILTGSNGMVLKGFSVTVKSGSNTLNVYGKNTAYTSRLDLYSEDEATRGKLIGTVSATGALTLEEGVSYDDNYQYIGMRSNSGALYLSSIMITWGDASVTPPTPDYTEVRNGLNAGEYYTMCLNKAVNAVQGGTIWKVVSKAANGTDVILGEAELPLDAGRPYIFCATASTLQVEYTGDAVGDPLTEGNNGLVGSFSKAPITKDANNYIIYNNELYLVNSDNVYVGANRAYLSMNAVPNYSAAAPAPGRRYITMSVHNEQTTTDLDALNASEIPVKMIINGQLFILRGEKLYNANGQLVK